jgi:hypothetical protein
MAQNTNDWLIEVIMSRNIAVTMTQELVTASINRLESHSQKTLGEGVSNKSQRSTNIHSHKEV